MGATKTDREPGSTGTRIYHCARCGRRLKNGRWVYSKFTHKRYCYAGRCLKRKAVR